MNLHKNHSMDISSHRKSWTSACLGVNIAHSLSNGDFYMKNEESQTFNNYQQCSRRKIMRLVASVREEMIGKVCVSAISGRLLIITRMQSIGFIIIGSLPFSILHVKIFIWKIFGKSKRILKLWSVTSSSCSTFTLYGAHLTTECQISSGDWPIHLYQCLKIRLENSLVKSPHYQPDTSHVTGHSCLVLREITIIRNRKGLAKPRRVEDRLGVRWILLTYPSCSYSSVPVLGWCSMTLYSCISIECSESQVV